MDKTRSRITLYALAGVAALAVPLLFSDGNANPLLLPSLAPALLAIALLARTCLAQLDAAHSLSVQLGEMIEQRDIRHLFVPVPGTPEMNAVGLQLNVLIYTLAESAGEVRAAARQEQTPGPRPEARIDLEAVADAA
jgi:hypothetical protein